MSFGPYPRGVVLDDHGKFNRGWNDLLLALWRNASQGTGTIQNPYDDTAVLAALEVLNDQVTEAQSQAANLNVNQITVAFLLMGA